MTRWARRLRAAVGMGVMWGATWVAAGFAIGVSSLLFPSLPWSAFFEIFDAPLPALGLPGFIGGALFSVVLGVLGKRLRFEQLSLPRFTAWGALGGVALAMVPQTMAALGLATPSERYASSWELTAIIIGPITILSALSACVTLLVARRASAAASQGGVETRMPRVGGHASHKDLTRGTPDAIHQSLRDTPIPVAPLPATEPDRR